MNTSYPVLNFTLSSEPSCPVLSQKDLANLNPSEKKSSWLTEKEVTDLNKETKETTQALTSAKTQRFLLEVLLFLAITAISLPGNFALLALAVSATAMLPPLLITVGCGIAVAVAAGLGLEVVDTKQSALKAKLCSLQEKYKNVPRSAEFQTKVELYELLPKRHNM